MRIRLMKLKQLLKSGAVLLILSMMTASCATLNTIRLDTLRPADYSVPPEILSVVLLDYSYPYRGDSVHLIKIPDENTVVVDTIWVDDFGLRAINSLASIITEREFFDSVHVYPGSMNKPPLGVPFGMPSLDLIASLCEEYNAQAVVALEVVDYETVVKIDQLDAFYYITLDAHGSIFWKLYTPDGEVLDLHLQKDSIYWSDAQSTLRNAVRSVPHMRDALENLAVFMGQQYAQRLSPYWEQVNRNYYSGGHHLFSRANDLIKVNNWGEAAKVWFHVFENGNKKQKARSAHNIALSWEVRGDFEEAVAWIEISRKLFEEMGSFRSSQYYRNVSIFYYVELVERREQARKLIQQIGG
jgi:hypothetical protein